MLGPLGGAEKGGWLCATYSSIDHAVCVGCLCSLKGCKIIARSCRPYPNYSEVCHCVSARVARLAFPRPNLSNLAFFLTFGLGIFENLLSNWPFLQV